MENDGFVVPEDERVVISAWLRRAGKAVRPREWAVLMYLLYEYRSEEPTLAKIAFDIGLHVRTVSNAFRGLESKGLVTSKRMGPYPMRHTLNLEALLECAHQSKE